MTAERLPGGDGQPADVMFVAGRLQPYLSDLLSSEKASWRERGVPWWEVPGSLGRYLAGGKALRPRFCFWGHATVAEGISRGLVEACAALELLHAFALIHDDLMDGSGTRRGRPALHRQFADRHRRRRWRGDPDAYGRALALLTGDLAFALASRLAAGFPAPARGVWDAMTGDLVAGQYLDLAGAARRDHSAGTARAATLLKSGRYTVTGPLRLGAALAGEAGLPGCLARYGDLVGEAFQLRDDLLGVFGDPRRTGKPAGEDLQSGKATLLIAHALTAAPPQAQPLLARLGDGDLTGAEIDALTAVLARCGARDRVERRIRSNVQAACDLLSQAGLPPAAAAALRGLATAATEREA